MSIITISRGSYSKGREIAEKVSRKLHYDCISRDILLEASEEFNVPEIKLVRAIHDAPSILEKMSHGRERLIEFMRLSLLRRFQKDNVVYHGLAGHFFVKNIPHVLKVRIIADMEDRVRLEMQRENIGRREALRLLRHDDEQRRRWSRTLYGIDTRDSSLYDLVIHIKKIGTDDAVDLITHTVGLKCFQTTVESQKAMNDLLLAAEVKVALQDIDEKIQVSASDGCVKLTGDPGARASRSAGAIEAAVRSVPGVSDVRFLHGVARTDYSNPWYRM